jgi:cytochrome P450 family 4
MLDTLLKAEKNGEVDADGIIEEVGTFMFAGHDTTSVAITFILFELAQHLDVQEKILKEFEEVKEHSEELTMNEINSLRYFDRVVKECLRLYPPVPTIARKLTDDFDMSK